jgi:hypothetical protein
VYRSTAKVLTAGEGKRMLRRYDWTQLLIIPYSIQETLPNAANNVEQWIEREKARWCPDDESLDGEEEHDADGTTEDDRLTPSYLLIGCWENRIQGPVLYVLVAGATDALDLSVKGWNKNNQESCVRICFADFREHKLHRRFGMLAFLRGPFEVGCVAFARVYRRHRLPDRAPQAASMSL